MDDKSTRACRCPDSWNQDNFLGFMALHYLLECIIYFASKCKPFWFDGWYDMLKIKTIYWSTINAIYSIVECLMQLFTTLSKH